MKKKKLGLRSPTLSEKSSLQVLHGLTLIYHHKKYLHRVKTQINREALGNLQVYLASRENSGEVWKLSPIQYYLTPIIAVGSSFMTLYMCSPKYSKPRIIE